VIDAGGTIKEIDELWITAGLGCDGDTIAMTAATQPSIEEVVLGALPWTPKVNLHNPFLALANRDDFLRPFHQAAEGKIIVRGTEAITPVENGGSPRRIFAA
jgi:hydrogenase small subunit